MGDIPLFLPVACLPCRTDSICMEPDPPGLFIQKQQLPEGFSREDYSDPVPDTRSFHAVSASLGKRGTNHCTECTLPLLLLFSLCVFRVTMVPAQITATLDLTQRQGETCSSLLHWFLPIPLGPSSPWCASTHFCARKFPLALGSILQFPFIVGVLTEKDCVYMSYMSYMLRKS